MRLHSDIMRRTEDGIRIDAPQGEVLLYPTADGIATDYKVGPLVNGSAESYAEEIKAQAIEAASSYPLPWRTQRDGSIRITDHAAFYEQSFSPQIECVESLKRWQQPNRTA